MHNRQRLSNLTLMFTSLALGACRTEELRPDPVVIASFQPRPDSGYLVVAFAPTDPTFEAYQAHVTTNPNRTEYRVWLDGRMVVGDSGGLYPFGVEEGVTSSYWYLDSGPHHFTVGAPGGAPLFERDGALPAEHLT
jgi:hypothetical protein